MSLSSVLKKVEFSWHQVYCLVLSPSTVAEWRFNWGCPAVADRREQSRAFLTLGFSVFSCSSSVPTSAPPTFGRRKGRGISMKVLPHNLHKVPESCGLFDSSNYFFCQRYSKLSKIFSLIPWECQEDTGISCPRLSTNRAMGKISYTFIDLTVQNLALPNNPKMRARVWTVRYTAHDHTGETSPQAGGSRCSRAWIKPKIVMTFLLPSSN